MSDDVQNSVLARLREIRDDIARVEGKVDHLGERVDAIETQMTGISLMMTTLFGAMQNLDHRIEAVERKIGA